MPIKYENGIKRPGSTTHWTPEQMKEIIKCGQDPLYFAENYFYIVHPVKGKQKIKLYDFQKRMINTFKGNRKTVVLSARQIGKTTCSALFLLWYAIFNEDKFVAILANQQKTAKSIVDDIKIAYEGLPDWMKPGATEYNNLTVSFENGTEIQAAATSPNALRGQSVSLLFLDEFAFVPENMAEDFWRSNYPTLSTGGNVIIVSTPNGAAGKFYDVYSKAEKGQNDFAPFKVDWNEHPDRDEDWKERTIKEFGKVAFMQEYGCSFTGSTNTLIDGDVLVTMAGMEPPENGVFEDGAYQVFIPPMKNHLYAFGVDTAQGAGGDYSVINIFDITNYRLTGRIDQVATWARNDKGVFEFAAKVLELTAHWNNPFVIVENNHLGGVLAKQLYFEDGYEHMFYDTNKGEWGVNANVATKALALTYFKDDIESERMAIRSQEMIKELGYFEEEKEGVFRARKGREFHDDYIAAGYWVSYMLKDAWFEDAYKHRMELMGISNNLEKATDTLQDESTLDIFMSNIGGMGGGMEAEQAMFDMEMWLSEEDAGCRIRQQNINIAHQKRLEELRKEIDHEKRRFDRLT